MPAPLENACERALSRIDAWDELGAVERGLVEDHARTCAACAEELETALAIAASFQRLLRPVCPSEVKSLVLERAAHEWAEREARAREKERVKAESSPWMRWLRIAWQPALAAGLLALVALLPATLSHPPSGRPGPEGPSAAEIARAEKDLKLALAYFGHVTATAETTLRREMVDNVIAPTRRAWIPVGTASTARR